jgi:beta-N-acetylhexosaminidase
MDPNQLSVAQLAGQRLMAGFTGTELNPELEFLIHDLKVGGIILFSRNLETPDQTKNLCESIQEYARACRQLPVFIAIDQEGGVVARLKEPFFTQFPGNPYMQDEKDAERFAVTTAHELKQVGINMDMAPVMDVAPKEIDSIMAERVFGSNPGWVSQLGVKIIDHFQQNKIMAVAKHFPGIGRTTSDSHIDQPTLGASLADLESVDLIPFEASIDHGVAGIMLSHIFYQQVDPQWPASLSKQIAGDLLRRRMGFDGIVLTDDLDMGAIAKHYDTQTVIQQILAADIDIALICHTGSNIEIAFEEIRKTLSDSADMKKKGYESIQRIIQLKEEYITPQPG